MSPFEFLSSNFGVARFCAPVRVVEIMPMQNDVCGPTFVAGPRLIGPGFPEWDRSTPACGCELRSHPSPALSLWHSNPHSDIERRTCIVEKAAVLPLSAAHWRRRHWADGRCFGGRISRPANKVPNSKLDFAVYFLDIRFHYTVGRYDLPRRLGFRTATL